MINFHRVFIVNGLWHMTGSLHGNFVKFRRDVEKPVWTKIAYDYDIECEEEMGELESSWLEEVFIKNNK